MTDFQERNQAFVAAMAADEELGRMTYEWLVGSARYEYSYHFEWLGLPIIQYPQDVIAMQEVIWATQPDLIVETGIARGGSLVFYASMLELLGSDAAGGRNRHRHPSPQSCRDRGPPDGQADRDDRGVVGLG